MSGFEVERTTVATGLRYPDLLAAFEGELNRLEPSVLAPYVARKAPWSEVEQAVARFAGRHGLIILGEANQGPLISLSGRASQCSLFLVGNPVIAAGIIAIDIRASFLVPFKVCLYDDGGADGASITYDRPSSFLATLGRPELTATGLMLDEKIDGVVAAITRRLAM